MAQWADDELFLGDTCHVDVIDRHGNMVAATPSGGWLSSSPVVPKLGFSLSTRLQMTWLDDGVPGQVAIQLVGVGVVAAYSAAMTAGILLAVNAIVRIRVPRDAEEAGLDLAQHGEIAYGA